jgi:hypothetical protein
MIKRAVLQHQHDDVVDLLQVREPPLPSHDKLSNPDVRRTACSDCCDYPARPAAGSYEGLEASISATLDQRAG